MYALITSSIVKSPFLYPLFKAIISISRNLKSLRSLFIGSVKVLQPKNIKIILSIKEVIMTILKIDFGLIP